MNDFLDIILHTDEKLLDLVNTYGTYTYAILFMIIFCETGLVFFPFLPGDALLFAAGILAATGALNVLTLAGLLTAAAILGNTSNYFIGRYASKYFLRIKNRYFQKYLLDANFFYEKHGGKAIVISRFFPVVRTYVPFVAGVTIMDFRLYSLYNIFGGIFWVALFVFGGYFLGNIPWAKENFSAMMVTLLFLTTIPFWLSLFKSLKK
ncbi:MAG: VTT domain-containing protein, partial [Bacteroidota bacterium]